MSGVVGENADEKLPKLLKNCAYPDSVDITEINMIYC